jgi:hypothetical protein
LENLFAIEETKNTLEKVKCKELKLKKTAKKAA